MNRGNLLHHQVFCIRIITNVLLSRSLDRRKNAFSSLWVKIDVIKPDPSLDDHTCLPIKIVHLKNSITAINLDVVLFDILRIDVESFGLTSRRSKLEKKHFNPNRWSVKLVVT